MIKPNGEIVPPLKCATCPVSCGCTWSCIRGDDLAEMYVLDAENKRLREHIEQLHAKVTCMCGDYMDHSPWAGHSPVSMFDYAVEQEVERRLATHTSGERTK